MTMPQETAAPAIVAPQVLLSNHLKALKLPTFAREYEKVAMELAQDRADYPRYLLAWRTGAHRSRAPQRGAPDSAGTLSADQELRHVRLRGQPRCARRWFRTNTRRARSTGVRTALLWAIRHREKRTQPWGWDAQPHARRATASPSRPQPPLVTNSWKRATNAACARCKSTSAR